MTKLKGRQKAKARKQKRVVAAASKQSYKKKMLSMILKYDNEALKKKCEDVAVGTDVSKTIKTMKKVLGCTENGVGLAASQIGILDRIIVVREDASKYKMTAMINPEIVSHSEEKKYGIEGCLSYSKTFAPIERYVEIEVKYFDENWKEQTKKYREGEIEGVIVQHEIEHLLEGNCQIHDWWEDPDVMQAVLQKVWDKKYNLPSDDNVVESEDLQKEKAEAVSAVE